MSDEATARVHYFMRNLAANILRIMRGAGKPYELRNDVNEFANAYNEYKEIHGHNMLPDDLASSLQFENEYPDDEMLNALHGICSGSLQMAASILLKQKPQEAAGRSEIMTGIRAREIVIANRRQEPEL